jgi:hypothetical protein
MFGRKTAFATALLLTCWASPALADDIDHPTRVADKPINGSGEVTGTANLSVGFPYHEYTASKDGFVRIQMETQNLASRPNDNEGKAWRPYLRVVSIPNDARRGEAWSTNGQQNDKTTGRAVLVFRVKAGEKFTVIASLAQNFVKKKPAANATYKLIVSEVAQ